MAYAASGTTVLHMKRLNQTESPIFVILCVLFFPKAILFYFYGLFHLWSRTHPLLQIGFQSKNNYRMANCVDPDKTARYEPSHLDRHCLQRYINWSVEMHRKG